MMTRHRRKSAKSPQGGVAPLAVLSKNEVVLLAKYLFDKQSQMEIARAMRRPQTTIGARIQRAIAKLEGVGFRVKRPGRRCSKPPWAPVRTEPIVVPLDAMKRLIVFDKDADGRLRGKWPASGRKPSED